MPRERYKGAKNVKTSAIHDLADVKRIQENLKDQPRNLCLFTVGVNVSLRSCDLVRIKVGDVRNQTELHLKEKKTGKFRLITLNAQTRKSIAQYLQTRPGCKDSEPLFISQLGVSLCPATLSTLVKRWCTDIGLGKNGRHYASHTLRKTWAYQQRVKFNTPIEIIMYALNHTNLRQTFDYLDIQPKELEKAYNNYVG